MRVPLVDLPAQFAEVREVVTRGLEDLMDSGAFIGGPAVGAFESDYAAMSGTAHCIGVANGTDALELALRAVGVGRDDEVVLPANTFVATAEAVARIGAVPVLVDVDADTLLVDVKRVRSALSHRTRAIVPVHLYGQTCAIEDLMDLAAVDGIPVIEDAAQSQGALRHGRPAGGLGVVAATSFYPGKNLGAAGDAGAVTTNDPELARRVRVMGSHGSERKYVHDMVGFNSRLDTFQAIVLRAKLARLSDWNRLRREAADRYLSMIQTLEGVTAPTTAVGNEHVWHLFVIQVEDRDHVLETLHSRGVEAGVHYPTPVSRTGAFAHLGYEQGAFPVAERAAARILSLPIYPHITLEQQAYVVEALAAAVR